MPQTLMYQIMEQTYQRTFRCIHLIGFCKLRGPPWLNIGDSASVVENNGLGSMPVWNRDQMGQTKIQTMVEPPLKLDYKQIEGNQVELREGFICTSVRMSVLMVE